MLRRVIFLCFLLGWASPAVSQTWWEITGITCNNCGSAATHLLQAVDAPSYIGMTFASDAINATEARREISEELGAAVPLGIQWYWTTGKLATIDTWSYVGGVGASASYVIFITFHGGGGTFSNSSAFFNISLVASEEPPASCPVGEIQTFGYNAGTWDETSFNFTGGPSSVCSDGCTYNSAPSSALDVLWYDNGTVWVNEEFISDGSQCSGQPDAPSESPAPGVPEDDWPDVAYCDQGGGSDGSSFCDTRDPNHPQYDPNLPPTDPGAIYCDEQGGHDGRSFCNTWSPHHPGHPDYDGTGDGSGGTSGDGSYPGPGGGGSGGEGEGGEGEEPPQIGFCPPGTVQSERHFHGEDQTAVCVPEGDQFDESLDGLDLSGELPPGWLVMPTLPVPSGGTCACPADHTISVMGSSVPISYGPICGVAELLRPVFLLLVYLGLAFFLFRMVAGGNK